MKKFETGKIYKSSVGHFMTIKYRTEKLIFYIDECGFQGNDVIEIDSKSGNETVKISGDGDRIDAADVCPSIYDAIFNTNPEVYDKFVDFIKNFYSPEDNNLAYKIEDEVNGMLMKMFKTLDKKYIDNK